MKIGRYVKDERKGETEQGKERGGMGKEKGGRDSWRGWWRSVG